MPVPKKVKFTPGQEIADVLADYLGDREYFAEQYARARAKGKEPLSSKKVNKAIDQMESSKDRLILYLDKHLKKRSSSGIPRGTRRGTTGGEDRKQRAAGTGGGRRAGQFQHGS